MFSAILGALSGSVIKSVTDTLFGKVEGIFRDYFNQKITKEQLQTELQKALVSTFAEVEKTHSESITKTYASFMEAAAKTPALAYAWAAVVYSQLAVLLWHQVGIPAAVFFFGVKYPSSGTTVDWAYALLAGCLGLGAVALRVGPGKLDVDRLKDLIKR